MFIQYSTLIDESKLPPGSYYKEPRDSSIIPVQPGESLEKFIERVGKSREEKGYPPIVPPEFKILVLSLLEHTTSRLDYPKYFTKKATLPQFSQIAQFAQILASQVSTRQADYNTRQARAKTCLSCPFHQGNNSIGSYASTAIRKVLDVISKPPLDTLSDLTASEQEQKLGICGMCGCGLSNKVRIDLMVALTALQPDQLDIILNFYGPKAFDSCWILSESVQNTNLRIVLEQKLKATRSKGYELLKAYNQEKIQAALRGTKSE